MARQSGADHIVGQSQFDGGLLDAPLVVPTQEQQRRAHLAAARCSLEQGWERGELEDVVGMLTWDSAVELLP